MPRIEELNSLADAIKHADGWSCERLKGLRPELFNYPGSPVSPPYLDGLKVFQPLGGESIYVTDKVFDEYIMAVKEFWNELAEALEKIP